MEIPYERGELSVIAYKNGVECGRSFLQTAGTPSQLIVTAETSSFKADNRELCYFDVIIADENGARIPDAQNELTCIVDGGELLGFFSGDPANEDQYGSNRCHAFEGSALAIVRTRTPGEVTVTIGAAGLHSGNCTVTAK